MIAAGIGLLFASVAWFYLCCKLRLHHKERNLLLVTHGVLVPSLFHHIATAAGSGGSLLFIVAVFRLSPVLRCILLPSLGQTYVLDTVQYSTVQYTEYSTIALVSNVCSG